MNRKEFEIQKSLGLIKCHLCKSKDLNFDDLIYIPVGKKKISCVCKKCKRKLRVDIEQLIAWEM